MDLCINLHAAVLRNEFFGDRHPLMYRYALLHNYENQRLVSHLLRRGELGAIIPE